LAFIFRTRTQSGIAAQTIGGGASISMAARITAASPD